MLQALFRGAFTGINGNGFEFNINLLIIINYLFSRRRLPPSACAGPAAAAARQPRALIRRLLSCRRFGLSPGLINYGRVQLPILSRQRPAGNTHRRARRHRHTGNHRPPGTGLARAAQQRSFHSSGIIGRRAFGPPAPAGHSGRFRRQSGITPLSIGIANNPVGTGRQFGPAAAPPPAFAPPPPPTFRRQFRPAGRSAGRRIRIAGSRLHAVSRRSATAPVQACRSSSSRPLSEFAGQHRASAVPGQAGRHAPPALLPIATHRAVRAFASAFGFGYCQYGSGRCFTTHNVTLLFRRIPVSTPSRSL